MTIRLVDTRQIPVTDAKEQCWYEVDGVKDKSVESLLCAISGAKQLALELGKSVLVISGDSKYVLLSGYWGSVYSGIGVGYEGYTWIEDPA